MIEELKPYESYKNPGIGWAERIPSHWGVDRARSCLQRLNVRSANGREELLTVSSARGVVPRKTAAVTMFKAKSYAGYKLCWPGDLVINSLWAWAGGLGVSQHHGIISSAYGVYRSRPTSKLLPRYLHELARSVPFNWELQVRSKGIWISRLQLSDAAFLSAPVLVPPPAEQAAIVRFLDHANHRIDKFIRAKKRLIALLNEQRQAIIHRTISRGLDPDVKLKDSGILWLGLVPAHWRVEALRRRWEVMDCKHLTVPFVAEGVPLASVVEVRGFELDLSRAKRTTPSWYRMLVEGGRRPKRGDLIYCRNASVGNVAIVNTDEDFAMGQDVCLIRSDDQNQRFLNYLLHSPMMSAQLELLMIGSTFKRINVADIKALTVLVPPRAEQEAICSYLDSNLSAFDEAVAREEHQLSLVHEYRARLVADVVTGLLDVRTAAASLPDVEASASLPDGSEDDEADIEDGEAA